MYDSDGLWANDRVGIWKVWDEVGGLIAEGYFSDNKIDINKPHLGTEEMIKEFQAKGKTIFFVSHSAKQVGKMCNKAIWLHYGEMVKFGACVPVANEYARFVDKYVAMTKMEQMNYKKEMLQKQKDRSKDYTIEKEKPNVLNVVTGLGLTGAFIVAMLFQLNVI